MVILGLGSNEENRLTHLRTAFKLIDHDPDMIVNQVSSIYWSDALLPLHAPESWNKPYLNLALRCQTRLTPLELLFKLKKFEQLLGRKPQSEWGPRVIDIDILAWDDLIELTDQLHIPHENLTARPFALWPLADVAPHWNHPQLNKTAAELVQVWGSRFEGKAPFRTRQIAHRIDTPQLVGILNITPDSFSDGGKYCHLDQAVERLLALVEAGSDIIDIGAQSTRPEAKLLKADEEWSRLAPILENLLAKIPSCLIPPKISVDTYHPIIAKKALDLGVHCINDVSALSDPTMQEIIANQACDVIVMHHLEIPANKQHCIPQNEDPKKNVYAWAENLLLTLDKKGIKRERVIFDVGIGYGKTAEQSLELLKSIDYFKSLNTRLLVGHSRKSFLNNFNIETPSERDLETTILSLFMGLRNIDYLRIHNVGMHSRAFKIAATVWKEPNITMRSPILASVTA